MMWLENSCFLSEPCALHSLQNRKLGPTNLIQQMAKKQLFTSVGHCTNVMHGYKERDAVFSLFNLHQTPLALLLLLPLCNYGSVTTCAFPKYRCCDEGQWAAADRLLNALTKLSFVTMLFYLPTVAKITHSASLRVLRGSMAQTKVLWILSSALCHGICVTAQITWLFHGQIPWWTTPALVHSCEICS